MGGYLGQDTQSVTGVAVEDLVLLAYRMWEQDQRNCWSGS